MDPSTNTSAALSDRAAALLERMAREQEDRERERRLDRPRKLYLELDRRYRDAMNQNVITRTMVQRNEEGLIVMNDDCGATRVAVSNADRIAAEVGQAAALLSEAEPLARQAHRMPLEDVVAQTAALAARAGIDLQDLGD